MYPRNSTYSIGGGRENPRACLVYEESPLSVDSARKPSVRFARSLPALFMTVRREIAEPRRETCARSHEDPRRTRTVRGGSEGRARRPETCRSSGSAIAAEALMNNAG